jgi:hypothetical protein
MANHIPGVGASISGASYSDPQGPASKERWVFGILGKLEQEENQLEGIQNRTDSIAISIDMSKLMATVTLVLNVTVALVSSEIIYTATHYLIGSTFTSGNGGDSNASNLAQAAHEGIIALKLIEMDKLRNLNNPQLTVVKRCTHTIAESGGTNATFSAQLEFPIEVINLPGGGSLIEAKNYLT